MSLSQFITDINDMKHKFVHSVALGKGKLFLFFEARKKQKELNCTAGFSARKFTVFLNFPNYLQYLYMFTF